MNEQARTEEQEVRDLIAGAGPRTAVPRAEVAKIKEAARGEWREMVKRERQRRRGLRLRGGLALAASVLLALAVGWWWSTRTAPVPAPVVASVELVAGTVRTGDAVELSVGGQLAAGDMVETAGWAEGSPAGLALRLTGGQSLRLAADTKVRLVSEQRLQLERGTLYVDSDSTAAATGVEVVTVLGSVRHIGTQFEVRLGEGDAAMRVRVREGEIALEADGGSHRAARGEQLSLLADGSVVSAEIDPYGPEWDWVMATAPGIEIDGRPVSTVLDWIGREMGREIRYAEPALAAAAAEDIITGSAPAGLGPAETLGLLTTMTQGRLSYQVDNGWIRVTAP